MVIHTNLQVSGKQHVQILLRYVINKKERLYMRVSPEKKQKRIKKAKYQGIKG